MHFINEKLNTELTVATQKEELYFDLKQIAKGLGYARPDKAVYDFKRRNEGLLENGVTNTIGNNLAVEWVMYLFIMESNTQRAKDFLVWVSKEVLPTVGKVGLQAIKELEVLQFLAKCPRDQEISREDLPHEVSDQFLIDNNYYWLAGYYAPSTSGLTVASFYSRAQELGLMDNDGVVSDRDVAIPIHKYHNSHTPKGIWYAWSQEAIDQVVAYEPEPEIELKLSPEPVVDDIGLTLRGLLYSHSVLLRYHPGLERIAAKPRSAPDGLIL